MKHTMAKVRSREGLGYAEMLSQFPLFRHITTSYFGLAMVQNTAYDAHRLFVSIHLIITFAYYAVY